MRISQHFLSNLLFSCTLLLASAEVLAQQGASPGVIKIGQTLALSGPLGEIGTEFRDGALAYFKWVNSKGGVHGRRIELITADDAYVADRAVGNVKKLLDQDKVFALFGIMGTANYSAVTPLISEHNIPSVAPYTGSDELRAQNLPNTFWVRASYGDETEKIIDQLTTLGINRIAVFYQDDVFGKSGLNGIENALKKRNLSVVGSGSFDKTTSDVSEAVKRIGAVDPQAVVMLSTYKSTAAFVKKMRQSGKQPQFFAISVVGYKSLQSELGQGAAGVAISQVMPYPWNNSLPLVHEFEALPKDMLPKAGITYTTIEGYISAKVLTEGLRRAGPQLSREKLVTAMEGMRAYDAGGFTVDYTASNRLGSHFSEVTIVGNSGRLMR